MTPFNPTTNSELTSGLPITQDIMRRLRDDGYTKIPDSGQTNELSTLKRLAPDGAGGVQWVPGSVPVFSNNGVKSAPQASPQTIIGGLPAGRHLLTLVSHRVNGAGTVSQGSNSIQVILNNTGSPVFEVVFNQGELGNAGWYPPFYNVASFESQLGKGTGTIGNITWTATSGGVTATWTNDSEYVMAFAVGLASN